MHLLTRNRKDSYLSIDMDYWVCAKGCGALRFLRRVFALQVPVFVCQSHEFLLNDPHINSFRRIINLDYHSDSSLSDVIDPCLCRDASGTMHVEQECHCGNWLDFVSWKDTGSVTWCYPNDAARQLEDFSSPFLGYKKATLQKGLPRSLRKIGAVGISYDAEWFEPSNAYNAAADFILDNIDACTIDENRLDNDLQDYLPWHTDLPNYRSLLEALPDYRGTC